MSYDLNILCVNQKYASINFPNNISIYVEAQNQKPEDNPKFYGTYCPFMNAINGIWYYLMSDQVEISSFELCDIYDDDGEIEQLYPFWYKDEDEDEIDVRILKLRGKYKYDIFDTIKYLIKSSPVNTIIFHSRYQSKEEEPEYIYGTFTFTQFVELLTNNKILFNTCYIIRDKTL